MCKTRAVRIRYADEQLQSRLGAGLVEDDSVCPFEIIATLGRKGGRCYRSFMLRVGYIWLAT